MKDNELSQAGDSSGAPLPCPAKSPRLILVVDDDSGTRQRSLEVLAGSGYDVEAVKVGAAGWDALQAKSYDLPTMIYWAAVNALPPPTGIEETSVQSDEIDSSGKEEMNNEAPAPHPAFGG